MSIRGVGRQRREPPSLAKEHGGPACRQAASPSPSTAIPAGFPPELAEALGLIVRGIHRYRDWRVAIRFIASRFPR